MGAPVSMLEGSPFTSFLIPGIVLFVLFGIGNVIGAILSLTKFGVMAQSQEHLERA
jgi:hypothetical protein